MRLVQKLEILFGSATLAVSFYFFYKMTNWRWPNEKNFKLLILSMFILLVGPALLVAAGAAIHSLYMKSAGFILVLVGTLWLVVLSGTVIFGLLVFSGWFGLIFLAPCLLAVATTFCAMSIRRLPIPLA